MEISQEIKNIDLVETVRRSGVELKQSGSRHIGLCPFHDERTASFFVFSNNHYHCFGCHESGDAVDFIRTKYGFTFGEALSFLDISKGNFPTYSRKAISEHRAKVRAKKRRVQGIRNLVHTLGLLIRTTHRAMDRFKTIDQFNEYGEIMDPLIFWEEAHDLLTRGSEADQDAVLVALQGMTTISRSYLWSGRFNYKFWLTNFIKEAPCEFEINLHFE